MNLRRKLALVCLMVATLVLGSIVPAAAITRVSGCPKSTWGPVDKQGKLSAPTTWKLRKKDGKACLSLSSYADGKKPLRIKQVMVYHDGLCNETRKENSINAFAHQLHGKTRIGSARNYVTISDGTRSKTFDFSNSTQVC